VVLAVAVPGAPVELWPELPELPLVVVEVVDEADVVGGFDVPP